LTPKPVFAYILANFG